jgi:pilus assembly protein CpaF
VASAIDLVVHLDILADGRRRVREIVGLSGRVEEEVIEVTDVFSLHGDRLVRGDGHPPHADRFARAGHDLSALLGQRSAA